MRDDGNELLEEIAEHLDAIRFMIKGFWVLTLAGLALWVILWAVVSR